MQAYHSRMLTNANDSIDGCVRTLIRTLRVEAGLRQAELAALLGQPQSFVSKYEIGDRELSLAEVRTICLALGASLTAFVERLEEMIVEAE